MNIEIGKIAFGSKIDVNINNLNVRKMFRQYSVFLKRKLDFHIAAWLLVQKYDYFLKHFLRLSKSNETASSRLIENIIVSYIEKNGLYLDENFLQGMIDIIVNLYFKELIKIKGNDILFDKSYEIFSKEKFGELQVVMGVMFGKLIGSDLSTMNDGIDYEGVCVGLLDNIIRSRICPSETGKEGYLKVIRNIASRIFFNVKYRFDDIYFKQSDGMVACMNPNNGLWGYRSRDGYLVSSKHKYINVSDYVNGKAVVLEPGEMFKIVNKLGEPLLIQM